jgi:hypothetical protein
MLKPTNEQQIEMQNWKVVEKTRQSDIRTLHKTFLRLMAAEPGSERALQAKRDWEHAVRDAAISDAKQSAAERKVREQFERMSPAERELALIHRDEERHEREKQAEAARREHLAKARPVVDRLTSIRAAMVSQPEQYSDFDLFLVDRAIAQSQAVNGDPALSAAYVADVNAAVATRKQARGQAIDTILAELEARRRELLAERGQLQPTRTKVQEAEARWRKLAESGAPDAERLSAWNDLLDAESEAKQEATEEFAAT